ncbi:hypothetical protein DNK06_15845 [Pseudomonas daroniae]|uniref:TRAP transporter small permease protein n=1 Tax=Phytopseudomonas daroniae TaxID=2487519 RepID=A0A4Q9QKH6_9GAMM|nr:MULTISPECIES: TRAP transporter small permease subunit [Pseudomonas]TBU76341.1 hypothetical protein DNK10_10250 [Pseudomonas daroniae]TBU76761.1 hypothetical protein DNK06_15845 [Pseudomonas daroniae]TBU81332.1 hypothetical protein DNK31_14560 [Pseudomonas sp. FRB 228]TBU90461.1 hypothetical protein DNJ99_13535 [Pseudomonas daroniae]
MNSPFAVYGRFVKLLETCALNVCGLLLAIMCGTLLLEIISRSFFGTSFIWSMELATICFIWVAFLGSTVGVLRREHFVVDLLFHWFPPEHPVSLLLDALTSVLVLVLGLVFLVHGLSFMESGMHRYSFSLGIKQGYTMLIMPLCGALFIVNALHNLLALAANRRIAP